MIPKITKRFQNSVFLIVCLTTTWLRASALTPPSLDTLIDNVAAGKDHELAMYVAVQGITDSSVDIREKSLRIFEKLFAQNEGFALAVKFLAKNKQHPDAAIQSDLVRLKDLLSTMQLQSLSQNPVCIKKTSRKQASLRALTSQKNNTRSRSIFIKSLLLAALGGAYAGGITFIAGMPTETVLVCTLSAALLAGSIYAISAATPCGVTEVEEDVKCQEIVTSTKRNLSALEKHPLLSKTINFDENLSLIVKDSTELYPLALAADFFQNLIITVGSKQVSIEGLYGKLGVENKKQHRRDFTVPFQAACIILAEKISYILTYARARIAVIKAHKDYKNQAGCYEVQREILQLKETISMLRSEISATHDEVRANRWIFIWDA